jgi:hypothetical protein
MLDTVYGVNKATAGTRMILFYEYILLFTQIVRTISPRSQNGLNALLAPYQLNTYGTYTTNKNN